MGKVLGKNFKLTNLLLKKTLNGVETSCFFSLIFFYFWKVGKFFGHILHTLHTKLNSRVENCYWRWECNFIFAYWHHHRTLLEQRSRQDEVMKTGRLVSRNRFRPWERMPDDDGADGGGDKEDDNDYTLGGSFRRQLHWTEGRGWCPPPTPLEESWRKANKNWNVPGCKRLKEWGKWFPFLESVLKFGSSTIWLGGRR